MSNKDLKESASAGATSAGGVATVCTNLTYPLHRPMPMTKMFGYKEYKLDNKDKKDVDPKTK